MRVNEIIMTYILQAGQKNKEIIQSYPQTVKTQACVALLF